MAADTETAVPVSPWRTVQQEAARIQCGPRVLYRAVAQKKLRAARIGGRRDIRLRPEWTDAFLEATANPVEVAR